MQDVVLRVAMDSRARGTFPALFWTEVADRAKDASTPVVIVLYPDGGSDAPVEMSRWQMLRAAKSLAANPKVLSVTLSSLDPAHRAESRRLFGVLGNWLHLMGPCRATLGCPAPHVPTRRTRR